MANAISKELPDSCDRVLTIPYPLPFSADQCVPIEHRPKRVLYTGRIHPKKGYSNWCVLGETTGRGTKEWSSDLSGHGKNKAEQAKYFRKDKVRSESQNRN